MDNIDNHSGINPRIRHQLIQDASRVFSRFNSELQIELYKKELSQSRSEKPLIDYSKLNEYCNNYQKVMNNYNKRLEGMDLNDILVKEELIHLNGMRCIIHLLRAHGLGFESRFYCHDLLHWLNSYFPAPNSVESRQITNASNKANLPIFPNYLARCAMRGFNDVVSKLIGHMPETQLSECVRGLMKTMPHYNKSNQLHFETLHSDWKQTCHQAAQTHLIKANPQEGGSASENILRDLLKLISNTYSQDESVLDILSLYCPTWYEGLVALIMFDYPTITSQNISELVELILDSKKFNQPKGLVEETMIAILTNDFPKVINSSGSYDPWMGAHIAELLEKRVIIEDFDFTATSFRDSITLRRSEWILNMVDQYQLMSYPATWELACLYLAESDAFGMPQLESGLLAILNSYPNLTDEVVELARKIPLSTLADQICWLESEKHVSDDETSKFTRLRYLSMMSYASPTLQSIVDNILVNSYFAPDVYDEQFLEILIKLKSYIGKYCSFIDNLIQLIQCNQEENWVEAGSILDRLIKDPKICLKVRSIVLIMALPTLSSSPTSIPSSTCDKISMDYYLVKEEALPSFSNRPDLQTKWHQLKYVTLEAMARGRYRIIRPTYNPKNMGKTIPHTFY